MNDLDIRAIFVDMDGTAVHYEQGDFHSSWDALGHTLCDRTQWDRALDLFYGQPEKYADWLQYNVTLLAGKRVADAEDVLFPGGKPPYTPGFESFFRTISGRYITGIISSGVSVVSQFIVEAIGIDFEISNFVELEDGIFTGRTEQRVPLWEKDRIVREQAARFGLTPAQVCFVGDNENDLPALGVVGLPVLFNPKDRLWGHTDAVSRRILERCRVIRNFRELYDLLD